MRNLVRADIRRICRKPSMWILLAVMFLIQIVDVLGISDEPMDEVLRSAQSRFSLSFLLLVSIYILFSVLANDKKSNSWAYDIGIGIERRKMLFAKAIDYLILTGIFYVLLVSERIFLYKLYSVPLSWRQLGYITVYAVFQLIHGVSILIIDMLVDIVTESTAVAILVNVAQVIFVSLALNALEMLYKVNLKDFSSDGMLENAYTNITAGRLPWQLIPMLVIYVGAVFAVAVAVFQKKELQL